MKVLITGSTGFLGKYLIDEFLRDAFNDVIAFGRNVVRGQQLTQANVVYYQGDFTSLEEITAAVAGADVVIHAGALSTVWGKWEAFYQANVKGTENVVQACLFQGVKRLVFVSSPSIYTGKKDQEQIPEDFTLPKPYLNHYIKSKVMAEALVSRLTKNHAIETVIIRPRGLFGIGDTSILPRLIHANQKIGVPIIRDGKNCVDITYVENVAFAVYLAATVEGIDGEVFNITNGEPQVLKTILHEMFEKIDMTVKYRKINFHVASVLATFLECIYRILRLKDEPILTKYLVYTLGTTQTLDISKAKNKLGYEPKYTIEEGMTIYAKWWRENHTD